MQDIFDINTITAFKRRINKLNANSKAQWGKMNAYQMLKHCSENEKMNLGQVKYERLFIGKLFGKMALKKMVKDDQPIGKKSPTHPKFVITGQGDFSAQKEELISLIEQYPTKNQSELEGFVHPFYGKMTLKELNIDIYKHLDHHLRQFGV